jgi:UDP-N-acetylglucosamine 2-epimerase (non-hydrolysing)
MKIFHIEAGLRSFDIYSPFPEEMNRKTISILSSFHFSPSKISTQNLWKERIPKEKIFNVGK